MIPYLIFWLWTALSGVRKYQTVAIPSIILIWLIYTFFIGLRFEVGADWPTYLYVQERISAKPFIEVLTSPEAGFGIIAWINGQLGFGILGTNLICAGIFSASLLKYCLTKPYPWLGLTLGFPYLTLVVSMNYTRQGVAISLFFMALLALENNHIRDYLMWLILASSFHSSAILMMLVPISVSFASKKKKALIWTFLILISSIFVYRAYFAQSYENYAYRYLSMEYQSQGTLIRVILCLIPGIIYIWKRKFFNITKEQGIIYNVLAILAIVSGVGLFLTNATTAIDRLALYLIPLQIFVGVNLVDSTIGQISSKIWRYSLSSFSFIVMWVWLIFSSHSFAWIPYNNMLVL